MCNAKCNIIDSMCVLKTSKLKIHSFLLRCSSSGSLKENKNCLDVTDHSLNVKYVNYFEVCFQYCPAETINSVLTSCVHACVCWFCVSLCVCECVHTCMYLCGMFDRGT